MPKGYWIGRVDIAEPKAFKAYLSAAADSYKKFGAHFLVRNGSFENPEGSSRTRNVVIEFPTYEAALDCWRSPEYQRAAKLRQQVSTIDLVIVEGYEGPQPQVEVAVEVLSCARRLTAALLTDASSSLRCACGAAKRERWASRSASANAGLRLR